MNRTELRVDVDRVLADLDELAAQSGGRHAGAQRLAWTPDWSSARAWLEGKLAELPAEVDRDEAGNLWATLPGASPGSGNLILGSHIDAVPAGGWLDGALGVLAALGTLRAIVAAGRPALSVRLVDWADEEGATFGHSTFGSAACAGTLRPREAGELRGPDGVTMGAALADHGVDLDRAPLAAARLEGARAYLELHIEQGPVLLRSGRLAAPVSGTFGVERRIVVFRGETAHAGSTPMAGRRDSVAAASAAVLAVREIALRHAGVSTVGRLESRPGVITAIAGETEMQLDQRHLDAAELAAMAAESLAACERAGREFGCEVEARVVYRTLPTRFDDGLVEALAAALRQLGAPGGEPVPSGALHDATEIGRVVPAAMLFVQSDPPVSHTRFEDSPEAGLRLGIEAYGVAVGELLASLAAS